jgi:hypothetical protein
MKLSRCGKAAACLAALAVAGAALLPARAAAQKDNPADGVELRPGLLVHPTLNVAYVMTPEGVAAVDVTTGAKQWTTAAAAKPLTLAGDLLVTQVEPKTAVSNLELLALNVRQRGAPVVRGMTQLPGRVRVSIGESLFGTFALDARAAAGAVLLDWSFEPALLRGRDESVDERRKAADDDDRRKAADVRLLKSQETEAGTLRLDLASGRVTRQEATPLLRQKSLMIQPRADVPEAKIAGAPPAQFESADGRHVLASERVDDDRVWDKYQWTIYERSSGRRLGQFRTHLSFTPFVVRGPLVIFETTPFARRGAAEEPAKLRAVSLETGREVWAVEVREIVYRGPYPP